jgi:hypothetical protein
MTIPALRGPAALPKALTTCGIGDNPGVGEKVREFERSGGL